MLRTRCIAVVLVFLLASSGCVPPPQSGKGFTLPPGEIEKGKQVFLTLKCNACHQIDGIDHLAAEGEAKPMSVPLGGEVDRISTYGELVTSIINPSHKLASGLPVEEISEEGRSKMSNYNDVLTVSQLIDLVAFLQSKYKLRPFEPTPYPPYGY